MSTDTWRERVFAAGHESQLLAPGGSRHWLTWLAVLVLVGSLGVAGGPPGAGVGVAAAAVWVVLGTPYAIAAGVALFAAVTPDGVGPVAATIAGTGLLGLVLVPAAAANARVGYALAVVLTTATLGGLAWLLVSIQPLWLGAVVLVGAGAVLVYGLNRYHRLRLGLLDEQQDDDSESDRSTAASSGGESS